MSTYNSGQEEHKGHNQMHCRCVVVAKNRQASQSEPRCNIMLAYALASHHMNMPIQASTTDALFSRRLPVGIKVLIITALGAYL